MQPWSRRNPCRRIGWAAKRSARSAGVTSSASGPKRASATSGVSPHTGAAFVTRFRQHEGTAVAETPAGERALGRPGSLFRIGLEAASLHEVDGEGERAEVEQQVLAAPAHAHERLPLREDRIGRERLHGGDRQRREALECDTAVVAGEPLRVRLDLGQLRHQTNSVRPRTSLNTASSAANTGWLAISRSMSPVTRNWPDTNAVCALRAPVARPTAVA